MCFATSTSTFLECHFILFSQVLSDKGGFGVAWFSAKVVDINENNAFVSYDNHNGNYSFFESCKSFVLMLLPWCCFLTFPFHI
jgi:hypothetical protein